MSPAARLVVGGLLMLVVFLVSAAIVHKYPCDTAFGQGFRAFFGERC